MNRARQESITTEILEIVGGAEALAQAAVRRGPTYLVDRTVRHKISCRITREHSDDRHRDPRNRR